MRSQDLLYNLNNLNFDLISKLNIYKNKKDKDYCSIKYLKILVLLDTTDKYFFKKMLIISDVISNMFNLKLSIFKTINKKNQKKNIIYFNIGCTIINKKKINNIIFYINNIVKNIASRIDNNLNLFKYKNYYIYNFNNLNYLLGFNSSKYYQLKIDYNLVVVYDLNKKFNNIKLKKFYEKVFFL